MVARIYRPARNAMQSGRAGMRRWVLEYEPAPLAPDPLMGWSSTRDTNQQITLRFDSREDAVAYASRNHIAYELAQAHDHHPPRISYADNYRPDQLIPFTH
jgi:pterin-4a-carbinolamine dehydratase